MLQTDDMQAFTMARKLVREEGLFCGGASGAIVYGAIEVAKKLGPGKTVVTVLTDSGSRYITKFLSDAWMKDHGFLAQSMLGTVADLLKGRQKQNIISAKPTETLDVLIKRLKEYGISQIPIVENTDPISMVHEEDILHKLQAGEVNYQSQAKDIAQPISGMVSPKTSLTDLNQIFENEKVAIVVDDGKIMNIISKIDMIDYMMSKIHGQ
jgi:cystathionine beta-synthase